MLFRSETQNTEECLYVIFGKIKRGSCRGVGQRSVFEFKTVKTPADTYDNEKVIMAGSKDIRFNNEDSLMGAYEKAPLEDRKKVLLPNTERLSRKRRMPLQETQNYKRAFGVHPLSLRA